MENEQGQTWHEEPERFREALSFTASQSGFAAALIEKDYYCSLLLVGLGPLFGAGLVFKGGTALSKVHAGFHRLSEDLDFAISIAVDTSRADRRVAIEPIRRHLDHHRSTGTTWASATSVLQGSDRCRQYVAAFPYRSCLTNDVATVKFEVGLREPIVDTPEPALARTMLLNPFTTEVAIAAIPVTVMSCRESYAEKIRAALSRREPAIRDFYDIDHAVQAGTIAMADSSLRELVGRKLAVRGNNSPDLSIARVDSLRRQVEPQLRPVLREKDFLGFELDRALEFLHGLGIGFA
jgi:predicted nucleotidyltransferase component of viral defense system